MIAIVQRVTQASVTVVGQTVGSIGRGLLVLAAVEATDTESQVEWIAGKLLALRIFQNGDKHFDLDIQQMAALGVHASACPPTSAAVVPTPSSAAPVVPSSAPASAPPGILLVSNFTVAAETAKGRRPSLSNAAAPDRAQYLFNHLVATLHCDAPPTLTIQTGQFGAAMQVALTNDGPATFILRNPA